MYDWSQVKIISLEAFLRNIFKKLDVCVKLHESVNALFLTIFKIMSLDTMFRNFFKASTSCMIGHK